MGSGFIYIIFHDYIENSETILIDELCQKL